MKRVLGALIAFSQVATAAAGGPDPVTTALEAFYATCLAYGPDYERTEATAKVFGWMPLPPETLVMLAPQDKPDRYSGWIASGQGYPNIKAAVAVTKAHLNGVAVQTCTMGISGINAEAFDKAFVARMHPQDRGVDGDGMQRTHFYGVNVGTRDQTVYIVVPLSAGGQQTVIASSLANEESK